MKDIKSKTNNNEELISITQDKYAVLTMTLTQKATIQLVTPKQYNQNALYHMFGSHISNCNTTLSHNASA